ncbi:hypothetical protein NDU88_002791 [Pleurodeles waltl]|uniref:Uncharacterized protein n=1 Tax=Pleurodeles waltl TaxID=8319 RepID=A0AAV7RD32_PLEWA|nr:hypothetical protein NDU88_002791 [Pleurodeles waltl]
MIDYYVICGYDPQSLSVEELQGRNEFLQYLLAEASKNVRNRGSAFATSAQDIYSQEKMVKSSPHASASQIHFQDSIKTKNPDTVQEATLGIPLFSVECFNPSRPVSQNSKCSADSYKDLSVPLSFQVSRLDPVSNGSVKTVGFLSSTQKACALPKLDDNIPVSIPKSSAKPFSILSGFDNNMDIHTLKEQFWQIKRQISDFYDEYVVTYTRNLAHGLFSSMHISLLPEPDILFICKVEEVTEQLMETTARQFENLKKENDHQLWLKEQYATSCASPKTSIEQIVPSINDSQKTAPVINISASSSDSLSACSSPVKIPVQWIESLTSLRDLTPFDSEDGSESSEGSVSAPLSEQIKPKEEESSDADSNSCTLRNQDMIFLEINGKLCNSVEESESSDDSGSCLAVNKPADSAVQMAHTPEFSDRGDTPALSNNIIEFSDNEETVPVSSELMEFSDREEIPAIIKNVMDFSESLRISSVSKQTVEISDKEESQQSEIKQHVIRNEILLLELDTVAASTTDPDLLIPANVYPVSSSTISEEQIPELPVSDLDVKSATPMSPAVSLKPKTPENQQSETEAQVLKDVILPTKTKDLNLNLVFEDLMISTVLSVLLQETIINTKAKAEDLDNNIEAISEETPVLFQFKEQPFSVNRAEDQLPVVETPCKETISDTTNTPQSTCNEEISVLSEDHPKELVCGTSTFSDVNPVSKDLKTLVDPVIDTPKSSKTKENSEYFMFTLRTPVTHVSQVSMLCKPQTTISANTAAETDISCLSEGVTDLTNTPIMSSKEDSTEQETKVLKNTAHDAIPDLLAPESTSPETNSMHSSCITRTIKRKDIGAHMGINTCFAHWMIHLWQDCKLINQEPDILFICKVEEVTEQLMETTARQFENLKKENDHQLWLKEQYATSCASPKTSIEQIVPSINDSQKTAPVINISASSSDSLSACSSPVKIPVQWIESLTSLRDLTPFDSEDGSESSEGSVSAPLSEQIKPKEEESSDADSNSCTLRNQDMIFLEINGKLCNSVEESESSDDSGSCLAVNKPADSAVQMAHTPEFSDCGDTPALSNNIIEFSDNEETVPVSSELMEFSDREEIPAIIKNVMDFSESLRISSVSKQTVEISDKEESQQSEIKQHVIRNEILLLELDTVAASTTDPDLLIPANVYPVSSSTISEEQIPELPVSDLDVKSATPMSPAVSLKPKTPENQQSETEAQVLKDVILPTKTKDLNLNLVFEDLMISTVLSVLLQETIINTKAKAEDLDNNIEAISEETPVLFQFKEQPFSVNRAEDQLPVVETPCKETISDTTNTPQSTCNEEISVLSEDHPKELVCGTSTFSDVNPVSKDLKTLVDPVIDTPKSSKTKENSEYFMFTLRTPVTHVSQVSMLCKPQTTISANTAAETDISCLSEGVTDLTNTPIMSSKEDSTEQETKVLKNTAHDAIPDLLAPESTSPETNSMHSSCITRTIKRKDIGAHMGINTCFAHWMIHLWQDCKLINQA